MTAIRILFPRRSCAVLLAAFYIGGSYSNFSAAYAQTDLPPVAAPTTSISVNTLPIVRTESQEIADYARGLVAGLAARENLSSVATAIVSQDRVDFAEVFGEGVSENALLPLGSLSDIFSVVAVMQLAEQDRLFPAEDLAAALGESEPRNVTLGDLLTQRIENSSDLLRRAVEYGSGMPYARYLSTQILEPLGMSWSRYEDDIGMLVTISDMSQFLLSMLDGNAVDGAGILSPASIELMQRGHFSRHTALPGQTYGFAEMQRNGWRALQRDGVFMEASLPESRIVIIPELQIAYFVSPSIVASSEFWRTLDNNLFDRLAPRRMLVGDLRTSPQPSQEDAMELDGLYRPQLDVESAVFLKTGPGRLRIEANGDRLRLSGTENLVLDPIPGGAWRSQQALVPAAMVEDVFWLGNMAYVRIPAWQRANYYFVAASLFATLTLLILVAAVYRPGFLGPTVGHRREIVAGLAGLTALLITIAVVLHSWA